MTDFVVLFGRPPDVEARASGRVNLIGEHTDYSGGFVLPMAIPQTTTVAIARNETRIVRVSSDLMRETSSFELEAETKRGTWIDYVQGCVVALRERGYAVCGFDATIASNVPAGSGLSSSAALEIALLRALRELFALEIDDLDLARVGRAAETDFVGAPIGIMDQMASSLADAQSALFLDTRSLAFERIALPSDVEIVAIDSGIAHDHATGAYATRREECERAAAMLEVDLLRDVVDLARTQALPDPFRKRARHVVSENARVLAAVGAMRAGDVTRLGALLDASHTSLRDDFEASVPPIDHLVALAQADPDVLGARMTGGGFGGAIVALARRGYGGSAADRILSAYGSRGRVLVP